MGDIDLVIDGNKAFADGKLEGISISRQGVYICKSACTDIEKKFLKNDLFKLGKLSSSGFAPRPYTGWEDEDKFHTLQIDLGESEPVTDEIEFRRNCALLLWTLKKHNIRHGDITTKNIIVKNNKPMLIDFQQSKFDHEPGPDKRAEGDAYWLWKSALELSSDTSRHIRKWQAIRPFIQGESIFDFGCAEGDYCLFARSENLDSEIHGYDTNKDAVDFAINHWANYGCAFYWSEPVLFSKSRTVFFMSVFAHIVKNSFLELAEETLENLIHSSKQLFFETQLIGDGPGIHKTDDDVYNMLNQYGKVEKLITIPVHGRDASRSVWRIT